MSDTAARSPVRSERAGSVASHHSHRSSARSHHDPNDPDADRRRRDEDREFERARDAERERSRERRRDSRDYEPRSERRRRDYPEDDGYYRDSKRRRSRSRDRGGDGYERERRSSRYHDDRGYDRRPRREPSHEPEYRPRHRRSPSYGPPARRNRSPSPQLSEEQREMRSIFVTQLAVRVTDRELGIFFEHNAGKVRDARVIVDRITRRSKGVGYVEFVELESVQKALTLSGTKLLGIPINVQYTEAEKNRRAQNPEAANGSGGPMTGGLYVGSLNFALTSEDIREVFQPFGELETVELHRDSATGKSKGYCFVKFKRHEDAMVAIEKMNNFSLAGREIKVGLVADRSATFSKHLAGGPQEAQLEREESTGKLDQNARIELMQKLARTDRPAFDLPSKPMFRPHIPQNQTRNVLMKNAFNAAEETERDWDLDLAEDVKGECESKYGPVVDIYVVKESAGEIYIRFEAVEGAVKAVQGLNGRWFGGRQIEASHATDMAFDHSRA